MQSSTIPAFRSKTPRVIDRNDYAAIRAALRTADPDHPIVLAVLDVVRGQAHDNDAIALAAIAIMRGSYQGGFSDLVRLEIERALAQSHH